MSKTLFFHHHHHLHQVLKKTLSLVAKRMSKFGRFIQHYTISRSFTPSNRGLLGNYGARFYSSTFTKDEHRGPRSHSTMVLYRRIWEVRNHKLSIMPVIHQWSKEGYQAITSQIHVLIKELRYCKRHLHALQVSDWLTNNRHYILSSQDAAIRLDLITKVHGIEEAEEYFNNISPGLKVLRVYCALIHCYCYARSMEKAEVLMQKMKELGLALPTMTYNEMLNLYCKTGNVIKSDRLMQEMSQKGIDFDKFTYCLRHGAYASICDIKEMEKILAKMELDPNVVLDWSTYSSMASNYKKVGLPDKALEMLKKSEDFISSGSKNTAYNYLMTQYARLGRKSDVLRIWEHYKLKEKVYNPGYLRVLASLVKCDDNLKLAEEVFADWESRKLFYDIQIPNVLIGAYTRKGLLMKAKTLVAKALLKGGRPSGMTYYHLGIGYLWNDQPVKAVKSMKKAVAHSGSGALKLSYESLVSDLKDFKEHRDMERAQDFVKLHEDNNIISSDIKDRLLDHIKCGFSKSDQLGTPNSGDSSMDVSE